MMQATTELTDIDIDIEEGNDECRPFDIDAGGGGIALLVADGDEDSTYNKLVIVTPEKGGKASSEKRPHHWKWRYIRIGRPILLMFMLVSIFVCLGMLAGIFISIADRFLNQPNERQQYPLPILEAESGGTTTTQQHNQSADDEIRDDATIIPDKISPLYIDSISDAEEEIESDDDDTESFLYLLEYLHGSKFARKSVASVMVNAYLNVSSGKGLYKATKALKKLEDDGEPIQIADHNFLFVGSVGASLNQESLRKNGITHIVNWSNTAKCNAVEGIEYMCVSGISSSRDIRHHLDVFNKAIDFMYKAHKSGGKVLSHCWYGKNRSVTAIIAYLMKYEGISADVANNIVRETRPEADAYFDALEAWAGYYGI